MPIPCPNCGASVPDGTLSCPHCHSSIGATQRISLAEATWCPECGALVAPGSSVCPKCGSFVASDTRTRTLRDLDLPDIGNTGVMGALGDAQTEGQTEVMTRIESAIPSAKDESSPVARRDRIPRPKAFAFVALLAVLVIGGSALAITHPWDPTATQTKATEPADTSMSGYPGAVEKLTGQDKTRGESPTLVDPFESLESAHAELGTLAQTVDESEQELRAALERGDGTDLSDGLASAQQASLDISNLISDISLLDDGDGAYSEALVNLTTLGNWLRNRSDALTSAWERAASSDDLAADASSIERTLEGATDYETLFDENYDAWAPERES